MKNTFIIFIVFITFLSCEKEKINDSFNGYYTIEYTNWAWGYQHNGWVIDMQGRVMSFDLPVKWNKVDSLGYISKENLLENITNCDSKIEDVSNNNLIKYSTLINKAINGNISTKINTANDAGQTSYICYQFDTDLGLYKKIILKEQGDFSFHNESQEAKKIIKWMNNIE